MLETLMTSSGTTYETADLLVRYLTYLKLSFFGAEFSFRGDKTSAYRFSRASTIAISTSAMAYKKHNLCCSL